MKQMDALAAAAAAVAAAAASSPAHAMLVTQWNLNASTPGSASAAGTIVPTIGTGTAPLVGGTTATFDSGDASAGSSDPATGDDSGWNVST